MNYVLYREGFGVYISKTIAEYSKTGIKAFHNKSVLPDDADYVFRWGTTSNIPGNQRKVVNPAVAIHRVYDKMNFRKLTADNGLAPKTWLTLADYIKDGGMAPVIVRRAQHERSENITLCNSVEAVMKTCEALGKGNYYISEYIKKDREFRVFMVSGKVAWLIEKHPKNKDDVTWGCVEQGNFEYVGWGDWPLYVVENAIRSFNLSKLDFGAADIIVKDGKAYTLEINTGPEVTPYYIECISKCFDYIVKNGKDQLPTDKFLNWRDVIHPAIGR